MNTNRDSEPRIGYPKEIVMPDATTTLPAAPRYRARARLAGVASATAAAVAVWLIVRYGTGLQVHTPAFGSAHRPAKLAPGFVAVVSAAASLAAWGVLHVIERTARNAQRAWILTSLAALAASLAAPLSGHGVTGTDRLSLICMHLAAGAVLVPVLALTIGPHRRPPDDAAAGPGTQPAVPAELAGRSAHPRDSQ